MLYSKEEYALNSPNQRGYGQIRASKRVRVSSLGLNEIGPAGRRAYRDFFSTSIISGWVKLITAFAEFIFVGLSNCF